MIKLSNTLCRSLGTSYHWNVALVAFHEERGKKGLESLLLRTGNRKWGQREKSMFVLF